MMNMNFLMFCAIVDDVDGILRGFDAVGPNCVLFFH